MHKYNLITITSENRQNSQKKEKIRENCPFSMWLWLLLECDYWGDVLNRELRLCVPKYSLQSKGNYHLCDIVLNAFFLSRHGYFARGLPIFGERIQLLHGVESDTETESMTTGSELNWNLLNYLYIGVHATWSGTVERRAWLKNVIYRIVFALIARASLKLCRCTQFRRLIYSLFWLHLAHSRNFSKRILVWT